MNYNNFDMLPELAFQKKPFGKGLATLEGGGGKSGGKIEKPKFRPPEAAPAVEAAATTIDAVTPEDEDAKKKAALKLGAKSLEIPLSTGVKATGLTGTGTKV
jgi:hypothetical protein